MSYDSRAHNRRRDRDCDKCGFEMSGIMLVSEPNPPRLICEPCGGKSVWDDGLESKKCGVR